MISGGDPPVALTIAGSDSGSGAGIQADLRAMAAFGVLATTAVTAITAQNSAEVRAVHLVPPEMVDAQIAAVLADLPVRATKTGMLGLGRDRRRGRRPGPARRTAPAGGRPGHGRFHRPAASRRRRRGRLPRPTTSPRAGGHAQPVGGGLLVDAAPPTDVDAMVELAGRIAALGPTWVLVKGGHLPGVDGPRGAPPPEDVHDVLCDGRGAFRLASAWVETPNTHGTGCSLSAALAANLAAGKEVVEAVEVARRFVHEALLRARDWRLGAGHGPIDHLGWSTG